jgi:hypothetical protein
MKIETLYTLFTPRLRKRLLLGGLLALALGAGIWLCREYQAQRERVEFITWVAKYRPGWSQSQIRTQWDKIKYANEHAEIIAPAPTPMPASTPWPTPAAILVPSRQEPEEAPKPADIPGGYWVESDNPQIGWHWIKGSRH